MLTYISIVCVVAAPLFLFFISFLRNKMENYLINVFFLYKESMNIIKSGYLIRF